MKIRQGFVSNSSSSSFLLIAKDGLVKEALKGYSGDEKDYITSILGQRKKLNIFGKKVDVFLRTICSEEWCELYSEIFENKEGDGDGGEGGEYEDPYEKGQSLFDGFVEKMKSIDKDGVIQEWGDGS